VLHVIWLPAAYLAIGFCCATCARAACGRDATWFSVVTLVLWPVLLVFVTGIAIADLAEEEAP
jgi:hypothetical protein